MDKKFTGKNNGPSGKLQSTAAFVSSKYVKCYSEALCLFVLSSIADSPKAGEILKKFENLIKRLNQFERCLFKQWESAVSEQVEVNLRQCLIIRNIKTKELYLNFNPQVCTADSRVRSDVNYFFSCPPCCGRCTI